MHGSLLTQDFISEGIRATSAWSMLPDAEFSVFCAALARIYAPVTAGTVLNEAQTEADLIHPVLTALGWTSLTQQQTNAHGRFDVPDALLFTDADARQTALEESRADMRFRHGAAIVESKRWLRPLDRGDGANRLEIDTPSSQMLRYLTQAEIASDRAVMWGILTNGRHWRLYWQGARSRSEEFLEVDLAGLLQVSGLQADLLALPVDDPMHELKAFYLLFRAAAFVAQTDDPEARTFHGIALAESRHWESRVSNSLGQRVFTDVFPQLVSALASVDPQTQAHAHDYREQLKRAVLTLLYRLLFVLYAEDRHLLPVHDRRYDDYSLRAIRNDIAARIDHSDTFSASMPRYWQGLRGLFRAIAQGDASLGLPAYNGGLFDDTREPLLARIELADAVIAPVIDALSRERDSAGELRRLNYRDLSVQQLGSIYERLLEQAVVLDADGCIEVRPASFARKASGSYYTHDDLVKLLISQSLQPLIQERVRDFETRFAALHAQHGAIDLRRHALEAHDPAAMVLALKVCDPAMGSGHFLVSAVDYLADQVLENLAIASAHVNARAANWHYESPIAARIRDIRGRLLANARSGGWSVDENQLDDRHIVRRMILKRVIHGVDKNPMAVELAKLSLWLHTFTVGAPLSFLDHHLRCGDALFGERVGEVITELRRRGGLFVEGDLTQIAVASESLHEIGYLTDIDIAEVHHSQHLMAQAHAAVQPLRCLLDVWHALRWLAPLDAPRRQRTDKHEALADLLSGRFGSNLLIVVQQGAVGREPGDADKVAAINALLDECRALASSEAFLHWELAFPTAWRGLASGSPQGGFDAILGNPPWDRLKLQQVEWFAERRPEIALQARAADRARLIRALQTAADPLHAEYEAASARAEAMARVARACGAYPLLSGGDINLYSLFVERAQAIVDARGIVAFLTPSGISADKGAADFFRSISTTGRLGALFDFENRKVFFPDVHASFKFSTLVFGGAARFFDSARCAFYLHSVDEVAERSIVLGADDFAAVNPNTGTAPIFRSARDAQITTRLYRAHPVLVDRRPERQTPALPARALWPVRYLRMFDMTNDSGLFRTPAWLHENGGYRTAANRWQCDGEEYVPLYEGKMVQAYDHRAASVVVNPDNVHRPAQPVAASAAQHADPAWLPEPQAWIADTQSNELIACGWALAFKHVTAPTNVRTMIAAICPMAGYGNSLPLLLSRDAGACALLLANLNSMALDFVCRQKVQGQNLNLYLVEQLPLIAPARFDEPLGSGTVGDMVRREVLRLSYTAHDLAPFARDLGYAGAPFAWDAEDRRHRLARLDALFMRLYGLDRDDAAHVLDSFPIVREADEAAYGRYRTRELVLAYMNALAAGDVDTQVHG
ncbi:MAG: restriction endonuclease [Gammaproteobacteria bacterium HGW-Gammaproteobacteria-4]|jgi:hypothetical protein|nr:MAG: restriction endonuclease [Gammaproteobacteria bacterium HGW-Gammaproteobacteria-4]